MTDHLNEILTTTFYGRDRKEKIGLILDKIESQDILKLLTLTTHRDTYNGLLEEAVGRINDIDFLIKLGSKQFVMQSSCSSTWEICQKRVKFLNFMLEHNLNQKKANTEYGTSIQNSFTHFLSKIEGATLKFFTNDVGGFWILTLQQSYHWGKSEYFHYLEKEGRFIQQKEYSNSDEKILDLGSDSRKAFESFIDQYNKKKWGMMDNRDDHNYYLKIIEQNAKHFIVSSF